MQTGPQLVLVACKTSNTSCDFSQAAPAIPWAVDPDAGDATEFWLFWFAVAPFLLRSVLGMTGGVLFKPCRQALEQCLGAGGSATGRVRLREADRAKLLAVLEAPHGACTTATTLLAPLLPRVPVGATRVPKGAHLFAVEASGASAAQHVLTHRRLERLDLETAEVVYLTQVQQGAQLDQLRFSDASSALGAPLAVVGVLGGLRLVLWHLLQPFAFLWVFSCFYSELGELQRALGSLVAAREAWYVAFCAVAACTKNAKTRKTHKTYRDT